MSDRELRELDAWTGENVMGMKRLTVAQVDAGEKTSYCTFVVEWINNSSSLPHYSTDPAAAMMVLEKCVSKIRETRGALELMQWDDGKFSVYAGDGLQSSSPSFPLAICLFAKQLFSK